MGKIESAIYLILAEISVGKGQGCEIIKKMILDDLKLILNM